MRIIPSSDESIVVHALVTGLEEASLGAARKPRKIPKSHVERAGKKIRVEPGAVPGWMYAAVDGIEVLGSLPEEDLRAVAVYALEFERMIRGAIGGRPTSRPYFIRIFGDRREFCAHATACGAANAMSFYDPRTYQISMWFDETVSHEKLQQLLAHEFTHAYMDLVYGTTSPLWFAEGMAEYFSSFSWRGGRAEPGAMNDEQISTLQAYGAVPLPEFVATPRSVMYGPAFPGLYAQAWSFVHFLMERDPGLVADLLRRVPIEVETLAPAWEAHVAEMAA